jgi:hypothetical protein
LASVVDGGERVGRWEETACYYTLEASLEVEEKPRTVFIGRRRVPKRRRFFLAADAPVAYAYATQVPRPLRLAPAP